MAFDLKNGFDNKLIVLTDGYFDFENSGNKMRINNRSTTTYFLSELKGPFWKETAIKNNYGLLKVKSKFPGLATYVVGFSPKKQDQLEIDKLVYFWEEWLKSMEINTIHSIPSSTPNKTLAALNHSP
ncbi:MAG: hypothetical protein IPO63_17665 [Bacteroidetes bacterium]|nr:hypothetical protein [Bacteroidota bacterium]